MEIAFDCSVNRDGYIRVKQILSWEPSKYWKKYMC